MKKLLLVLKVGSVRFTAFYFLAFYTAAAATGHGGVGWVLVGLALWSTMCVAIELTNRYADRTEDAINRPERTRLCHALGYPTLAVLAAAIFALHLLAYVLWFCVSHNLTLLTVQLASWTVAWGYSVGPRFKAHRFGVLVALCGTFVLPLLYGWVMYGSLRDVPLALLFVVAFVASISGAKDVTDVEGDRRRGYHSVFVALTRLSRSAPLVALLLAPYGLLVLLVALGSVEPRFLALTLFIPISFLFARLLRSARAGDEAQCVREWVYHFWFVVLCATMALIHGSAGHLLVIVATMVFWVVATRRLHWHDQGLRPEALLLALQILLGGRRDSAPGFGSPPG
ncbi:MAG: UbiA family prenyltransferase [Myxococcota bacterium]